MCPSMPRLLPITLAFLLGGLACWAADTAQVRQVIPLKALGANQIVCLFSPAAKAAVADPAAYRQDFANRSVQKAVKLAERQRRNTEPQWRASNESSVVPGDTQIAQLPGGTGNGAGAGGAGGNAGGGGGKSQGVLELPEGMDPPVAVLNQNAVLVHGTVEAIDQFREIVEMLDKPQKMVRIECKLIDAPAQVVDEWGLRFSAANGSVAGGAGSATATPNSLALRYALARTAVMAGLGRSTSQGLLVSAPSVTTTNMIPAILSIGQTLPYWSGNTTYDAFGNPQTTYNMDAVFVGVELYVLPRINGDNSVTMYLEPTFTDAVGTAVGPDGLTAPITQTLSTATQVTVPDGESIVLGSVPRGQDTLNVSAGGLLGSTHSSDRSNPVMIVTPHVLPPATPAAEEVWH